VLAEQLEHHHGEEEDGLFPKSRKLLPADAREQLGVRMQAQFDALLLANPRRLVPDQTDAAAVLP